MVKNYHKVENQSFAQVIRNKKDYIEKGLYFKHLSRYLEYFERSQIFITTLEEIKDEPVDLVRRLYKFLEVDETFIPKSIYKSENSSKTTSNLKLKEYEEKFVNFISGRGGGKLINILKKLKAHKLIHWLYTTPYKYPAMNEEDKAWLKSQFIEDINKLEKLLGRDFSHWK